MGALLVEWVSPANGEGEAYLQVTGTDLLRYTPPDGDAGASVSIAAGETKLLRGLDGDKAIRVQRTATGSFAGQMTLTLVEGMNGVVAMQNVENADRVSGSTCYRAIILKAHGTDNVKNIYLWTPLTTQPNMSLASEAVGVGGNIQTIATEKTAPTGLSWVTAATQASGLYIPQLLAGDCIGVWIRRVFPSSGVGDAYERVGLGVNFVIF
jgi:hypothetical protein